MDNGRATKTTVALRLLDIWAEEAATRGAERCSAIHAVDGRRCEFRAGHAGPHVQLDVWDDKLEGLF